MNPAANHRDSQDHLAYRPPISSARQAPDGTGADADAWVHATLGYVPSIARRFLGRGSTLDELVAAGNLGLVEAARRYDPDRGVKFTTYATWWIRKAILDGLGTSAGPLRLPRYQYDKLKELRRARDAWCATHGREPSATELASASGLLTDEVHRLLALVPDVVSLDDQRISDDTYPISETVEDVRCETPDRAFFRRDLARRVRGQLAGLVRSHREILSMRYGLGDEDALTLRETGRRLGISRERVRRVETKVLAELRERF